MKFMEKSCGHTNFSDCFHFVVTYRRKCDTIVGRSRLTVQPSIHVERITDEPLDFRAGISRRRNAEKQHDTMGRIRNHPVFCPARATHGANLYAVYCREHTLK
jgi:hypothetical protein